MSKKKAEAAKPPEPERTFTLNVRERQFLRGLLIEAARVSDRLALETERMHVSMELQQGAFMADRLLGKLEEPLEGFGGVWKVKVAHWRRDR